MWPHGVVQTEVARVVVVVSLHKVEPWFHSVFYRGSLVPFHVEFRERERATKYIMLSFSLILYQLYKF